MTPVTRIRLPARIPITPYFLGGGGAPPPPPPFLGVGRPPVPPWAPLGGLVGQAWPGLVSHPEAAVDRDDGAGDVGRVLSGQEHHRASHLRSEEHTSEL